MDSSREQLEKFRKSVEPYVSSSTEFVQDCYNYYIKSGGDILDLSSPMKVCLLLYKCKTRKIKPMD